MWRIGHSDAAQGHSQEVKGEWNIVGEEDIIRRYKEIDQMGQYLVDCRPSLDYVVAIPCGCWTFSGIDIIELVNASKVHSTRQVSRRRTAPIWTTR